MCKYFCGHIFPFLLVKYLRVRNWQIILWSAYIIEEIHQQYIKNSDCTPLSNPVILGFLNFSQFSLCIDVFLHISLITNIKQLIICLWFIHCEVSQSFASSKFVFFLLLPLLFSCKMLYTFGHKPFVRYLYC